MWGPQGLLLSASGEGKGRKQTLAYSSTEGFPISIPWCNPFFVYTSGWWVHNPLLQDDQARAQCHNMLGESLSLLPGTFSKIKQSTLLMLTHARFWGGLMFPVHNQLIPDQHWFLLSMNPPSFKVLVLCVGKEIYNINSKRLHKGYFSFFFSTASSPFFIFIRTWQSW